MKKIVNIIILVISIVLFLIGILINSCNIMLISNLILLINMINYAFKLKENGLLLLVFLIAFFTFLLGDYTVNLLTGVDWTIDFNNEINTHIQICLFFSLIGIYIGFYIANKRKKNKIDIKKYDIEKDENIIKIRKTAKILFYCTWIFNIIVVMEKVIFVQENTYIDLYASYSSNLPTIIVRIAQMNTFLIYIFLATLPSKKEIKYPMILFLFTEIISILSGGRSQSVTAVLFIIAYFLFREYKNRKDNNIKYEWVKKSYIKIAVIVTPLIIAFLGSYNLLRNNIKIDGSNIWKEFIRFFSDQGGSVKLIGYIKQYEDQLPSTNITYLFNPIIGIFKDGVIGKILFNTVTYRVNTIEMALYGNNLGATISYLVLGNKYLQGYGLGTQYIAEAYADFGYIGVFVFNVFLGFILRKFNFRSDLKWYFSAIMISIIRLLIYVPRNFALSWFSAFFSITNWGTIILVVLISRYIKDTKKLEKEI